MNETPQQYIQRILGHVEGQQPLKVQSRTAAKIGRLLQGQPSSKLRERPAPEAWSITEIVTHLLDAEIVGAYRLRTILGTPGVNIAAYDQDVWIKSGHYHKRDARKSLEHFRAIREANLALLKTLTPEQWKHYGMHAERGQETIERLVRMHAGHDLNHLKQIERILKPGKGTRRKK
ncbi:MAG: DinB family protein [Candidatus Acidiferrales bacterium]